MANNENLNYEPVTTEPDSELGKMLYALNGNPVDVPYPTSEFTTILYALLGYEIELPEPHSEASRLLYQYYIEGGGGTGDYQAKNVEPDFADGNVVIVPDEDYDALSRVTIEKDSDLTAANIKKNVVIFGITGSYDGEAPNCQSKTVEPDMSEGDVTVNPDDGYDGLSSVTITKDSDLIAENIKKNVEIFGVTGSYEMPSDIETDMNAVLNKKMGTTTTYAPDTWADTVNLMGKLPEKTASGAIASFDDGADDVPIVSGIFDIVAQQEGSGDPSPSNPRPITGYTGMTIHRADGETPHVIDTEYEVDWTDEAGTVYGGTLNATTGVLTEVEIMSTFTGAASENWVFESDGINNRVYIIISGGKETDNTTGNIIKKVPYHLNYPAPWTFWINTVSSTIASIIIGVDSTITSANDWKTILSQTNLQIVFGRNVEQTVQLDPVVIPTLLGNNNIYCDTGDSSITYRADIDLLLQNL